MPYVQFESVGDFIPEPRCSKFAVGLQTRRRKMGGYKRSDRTLVRGTESDGNPTVLYVFECVLEV